jgi:hypothetical protein
VSVFLAKHWLFLRFLIVFYERLNGIIVIFRFHCIYSSSLCKLPARESVELEQCKRPKSTTEVQYPIEVTDDKFRFA